MSDLHDRSGGYPELLLDIADQVAAKLAQLGVSKEKSAEIGVHVAEHIRTHWSGQSLYLPKGVTYDLSQRDRQIYEEFNGRNHAALARKHGVTEMRIYQIVKAARAAHLARAQPGLF